ncbi:MAG: hypothetical protein ACJAWL_000108 [Motiliproteus sp.]|jgi:hypothetical protein
MLNILLFIQRHWLPITLFNLLVISVLSLWPAESLPSVPGSDKTHHLLAYASLMFPSALRNPRHLLLLGLLLFGWSGAIELIQPHVNRYGEWLDLAANGLGVCLGYAVARLAARSIVGRHFVGRK